MPDIRYRLRRLIITAITMVIAFLMDRYNDSLGPIQVGTFNIITFAWCMILAYGIWFAFFVSIKRSPVTKPRPQLVVFWRESIEAMQLQRPYR